MAGKRSKTQEEIEAAEEQIVAISKQIDYYITEYTIELLTNKLKSKELVIPSYQREFTWEHPRKSKFIESIFMGLPIPFIFFWENPETGALEIVDGSQRLRTLEEFIFENFKIDGLEKINKLNGFTYKELSTARQRIFKNKPIRAIVLKETTDTEARFDLFERINTGSKIANPAEIRRAALAGPFMDMVTALSEKKLFTDLTPISKKLIDEREREELIIRFFAYGDGIEEYKDNVKSFLYNYLKKMNEQFVIDDNLRVNYEARFSKVMSFIKTKFPYGFHKSEQFKAVPRARFESISIGLYLALSENSKFDTSNILKLMNSKEFKEITKSDSANNRSKLEQRIAITKHILLGMNA